MRLNIVLIKYFVFGNLYYNKMSNANIKQCAPVVDLETRKIAKNIINIARFGLANICFTSIFEPSLKLPLISIYCKFILLFYIVKRTLGCSRIYTLLNIIKQLFKQYHK